MLWSSISTLRSVHLGFISISLTFSQALASGAANVTELRSSSTSITGAKEHSSATRAVKGIVFLNGFFG